MMPPVSVLIKLAGCKLASVPSVLHYTDFYFIFLQWNAI
jgi:hypothetical protein